MGSPRPNSCWRDNASMPDTDEQERSRPSVVGRLQSLGHACPAMVANHSLARRACEPAAKRRIVEQSIDGEGELLRTALLSQPARDVVLDRLAESPGGRGNYRGSGRECLEREIRQAIHISRIVANRGDYDDVGRG